MKPISISVHAREQAHFRGATEDEIRAAVEEGNWQPAARGRMDSRLVLQYGQEWNGKHYSTKCVRPIFLELPDRIIVVTVYTYYYNEERDREDNV